MIFYTRTLLFLILICSCIVGASAQTYSSSEVGNAVYYADYLHGRKTASGELYDKNALTAAHKTLDFGTILKVTRLDNGKSITVRVNDRGPFGEGLVVDISRAAASKIGLLKDGKTRVQVDVIGYSKENPSPSSAAATVDYTAKGGVPNDYSYYSQKINRVNGTAKNQSLNLDKVFSTNKSYDYARFDQPKAPVKQTAPPRSYSNEQFVAKGNYAINPNTLVGGFVVQVGAFGEFSNANRRVDEMKGQGMNNVFVLSKLVGNRTINKVVVGPYNSRAAADSALKSLKSRYALSGFVTKQ